MAEQAHVRSFDAIETFRAELIAYLGKTRPVVEDACDDVARIREWLENDRRVHWENQARRRERILEDAQQALFSAKLSNLRDVRTAEQMAVLKARRAVDEAHGKLRKIRKWIREYDNKLQPLLKELEHLRSLLGVDLPKAALYLVQVVKALEAYAQVRKDVA
ncbi:MAG TPA: hypothetical protein VJ063_03705 [Verrucomicrobiae bacterium]|nr:hypothetical protein [Verrucomicrobiae bacterium]